LKIAASNIEFGLYSYWLPAVAYYQVSSSLLFIIRLVIISKVSICGKQPPDIDLQQTLTPNKNNSLCHMVVITMEVKVPMQAGQQPKDHQHLLQRSIC